MEFQFKKLDNAKFAGGTSEILFHNNATGIGAAQFRGSVITLFGEPIKKTNNAEHPYLYVIETAANANEILILTIYEGPSGPAIGGNKREPHTLAAAKELMQIIETTKPTDFEEELIYADTNTRIYYGCKAGECFYKEQ